MGKYDSSKTRVVPTFDELFRADASGRSWIGALMRLGHRSSAVSIPTDPGELILDGKPFWGENERALGPPLQLLEWLLTRITPSDVELSGDRGRTRDRREALAQGDPDTHAEAMKRLRAGERGRKWFVLEGQSYPDAYIETERLVLVIEGKRTEASTTSKTKWMPRRSQLLRHMDAAYEVARGRPVYGLLLVEGEQSDPFSLPFRWRKACDDCVGTDLLQASLPHRNQGEQLAIAGGVLGATTWQRVWRELSVKWPREVTNVGGV